MIFVKEMAIYVGIKKLAYENGIYYYSVSTNDFGGAHFYIKIDVTHKVLDFFTTSDFSNSFVCSMNAADPEPNITVKSPLINFYVVPYVFLKVHRALINNEFPTYLDYCA